MKAALSRLRERRWGISKRRTPPSENDSSASPSPDPDAHAHITDIRIIFTRPNATYREGEVIEGAVCFDVKSEVVIEEVSIEFNGTATVNSFRSARGRLAQRVSIENAGCEIENHLNQRHILYTPGNFPGDDSVTYVGHQEFRFRIQLPMGLPSSFTGDHGNIRYKANTSICLPWKTVVAASESFTIISIVNLNAIPNIRMPVHCEKSSLEEQPETILCLPVVCHDEHFIMIWRLDRTGYVPGEKIRINGEVHNNSRNRIRKSKVELIQHVQYFDMWAQSVMEKKQVAMVEKGPIGGGQIGFWREHMEIPHVPPSGLKGCNMINLWYTLKFVVIPTGLALPMDTSIVINIGTIPLDNDAISGQVSSWTTEHAADTPTGSATCLETIEDFSYFV